MPRYDYRCSACGEEREVIHPMSVCDNGHVELCLKCGEGMRRKPCAPNVHGIDIYPFTLGHHVIDTTEPGFERLNCKMTPDGAVIENKSQHKAVMENQKCVTPALDGSKCNDFK
jgi:putative FmdB family regulatory protein